MKIEKFLSNKEDIIRYRLIDGFGNEVKTVSEFLIFLKAKNYSPNTIKNYAYDLKYYFTYLAHVNKQYYTIKPKELVEFLDFLQSTYSRAEPIKRLSPATLKRILAAVSSFYDWLEYIEDPHLSKNPQLTVIDYKHHPATSAYKSFLSFSKKQNQITTHFIRIKQSKQLPRPLSEENIKLLAQSLRTWRDKSILFLALQGGMRIGEILGLCLEDIHFRKREINIRFRGNNPNQARVKGMHDRNIYIEEPEALNCLNYYLLHERPNTESSYVFLSTKGSTYGKPLTYQGIYTVFEYYCTKLGIKNMFNLHRLRHTHATKMYEKGMGLLSLQKRLGHASPQTTQIYAYVSDEKLKEEYRDALRQEQLSNQSG